MFHPRHTASALAGGAAALAGAAATALVVYVKAHALHITFSAASAAVKEYLSSRNVDLAVEVAMRAGLQAASGDAVRDFLRFQWKFS